MAQKTGMLWFDDHDHRTLEMKIRRAVAYYKTKYQQVPTVCYVHPSMVLGDGVVVDGVQVEASTTVLPNHFWLGQQQPRTTRSSAA